MAKHRKVVITVAVIAFVALAFAAFVVPGFVRYSYTQTELGMFGTQQTRTDRFTGGTEIYGAGRWQPIEIKDGNVQMPEGTAIEVK